MMNEKTINEQYAYIRTLLEEKRLKEALMQLESLLWQCPDWDLRTRLEQLQTSYKYMLEYMKQGANDPERWNLYQKMVSDTWGIADQSRLLILDNASSRYYHEVRRTPKSPDLSNYGLKTILHILESFNDDLAVSGLLSDEKMDEVLKRHEDTLKFMFIRTWTNSAWTPEDEEDAKAMLASELLPGDDLCLFVSALTLSLMECFDLRKIMWLLDAYEHPNVNVSQRALVGAMIIFHIYRSRLTFYPELIKRVDLMEEIPSFREDVARIYRQMLLCQETEKIDKKMREEIIPEMLKNVSSMKNMRFGFEESDEENNDMNPDWEDAFEKSGLGDKLREMNELQLEGADVYMSTFAALKNYPFFREVHNWFYPFSKQQSNVLKAMKQAGNQGGSLLDLILQSGFFSNSDKYSLFFTIHQLPQSQQDMMLSQLNEQQVAELAEKSNVETMKKFNERPGTVSNQYLHDLYRFFKLSVRKSEFRDIFKEKLDLHHVPALDNILHWEDVLFPIADFYLSKERWDEAIEIYEELETIGGFEGESAEYYQKFGYALQKRKKYAEAIQAYLKADTLKPDNIWNNRHLAICYRLNRNYQVAITYYKKVEEAAKILDLSHLLDRKPKAMSGGQRQRVALGRAIVRNPQVFLLDEPLSNLDAKLRAQMRTEISKLHKKLGTTFIYVTHDQTEAMTMGDRIVVMKDGIIQQVDTPQALYEKPGNKFVAGFLGSPQMNFIDAVLKKSNDYYVEFGSESASGKKFQIAIPAAKCDPKLAEYVNKPVVLGIRPESLHDDEMYLSNAKTGVIECDVEITEMMGAETYLYLLCEGVPMTARVDPRSTAKPGDHIKIALDPNKIHLFDKDTEETIIN